MIIHHCNTLWNYAKKFNAKQKSVVLFKKFDEKRNDLTEIKEKELSEFVDKYSQKKVSSFDDKTTEKQLAEAVQYLQVSSENQRIKKAICCHSIYTCSQKLILEFSDISTPSLLINTSNKV